MVRSSAGAEAIAMTFSANTPISFFKTDDVVIAEISARPHSNQFLHYFAGSLKPMARESRYTEPDLPSAGTFHRRRSHTQGAADHDPVFGAPMLHLERKARPKIDDFVLDLKAFARVETVVGASRAIAFRWASTLQQRRGVKLGRSRHTIIITTLYTLSRIYPCSQAQMD